MLQATLYLLPLKKILQVGSFQTQSQHGPLLFQKSAVVPSNQATGVHGSFTGADSSLRYWSTATALGLPTVLIIREWSGMFS